MAIPEPWATELQDYRTSVGDAMAATIPTHITLLPPTEVSDAELTKVEEHLESAGAAAGGPRGGAHAGRGSRGGGGRRDPGVRGAPARHGHVPAGVTGGVRQP